MKTRLLLLFCVTLVCVTRIAGAAGVSTKFSDKGLSSLQVDGVEFLVNGSPAVSWITGPDGKPFSSKLAGSAFDSAGKTLTMNYDWGTLTCVYEPLPDGLRIKALWENTGDKVINGVTLNLLSLKLLGEGRAQQQMTTVQQPAFTFFKGTDGTVVLGAEAITFPLSLDLRPDPKKNALIAVAGFGGGRVVVDGVQMTETLEPGQKREFTTVLRAGPAGTDAMNLAGDFLEAFRKVHPAILEWPDRRPILRSFFGGGLPRDQALANLKDPSTVVTTAPDEKFRSMILKKFDGMVEAARAVDAQGFILWDLEGGTFPHATTYIGDPRLIKLLNPQMDLIADEAIKKLTDAGLNVGITLRPSRVIYDAAKNDARHSYADAGDAFSELDGKVAYARERWGCKIFYVDTNYFWRPYGPEKKWQSGPITAGVWRQLRTKYPDTLFIPEFTGTADYASVAGYGEADMGDYGMPAAAKALYPDAFRVIVIEDADPSENFDRFVSALHGENVLMTFGQSASPLNVLMINRMKETLALRKMPVPPQVAAASPADLVKLLSAEEPPTRFHAAQRLIEEPREAAAPRLLEIAQNDKELWPVRRAAVVALGKLPYPPAVPALFEFLEDRKLGLYGDAARALAGQDASVETLALARIRAISRTKVSPTSYDQMGSLLVLRKASGKAAVLQELALELPAEDITNRRALITLIGELRNPESEAFLLPFLTDPKLAPVAVSALVRIGSTAGVEQARTLAQTAKASGDKAFSEALGRALQVK